MEYRIEHDTMGEMRVPADKLWGAQTQRSLENFPIGTEKMPLEVVHALALLKMGAAKANAELGMLEARKSPRGSMTGSSRWPSGRPEAEPRAT